MAAGLSLHYGERPTAPRGLPKVSLPRRALGSGLEFVVYLQVVDAIRTRELLTNGLVGCVGPLLFFVFVGLRDVNAGAFSLGKRLARLRVVDRRTGLVPSNLQAVLRNVYYLLLLLTMSVPGATGCASSAILYPSILIDLAVLAKSPGGMRLGDHLAGTQVVQVEKP